MTIPPRTGRALTTGITHVISLNAHNGPPGRCCHDPTGQMKRLRLGEANTPGSASTGGLWLDPRTHSLNRSTTQSITGDKSYASLWGFTLMQVC